MRCYMCRRTGHRVARCPDSQMLRLLRSLTLHERRSLFENSLLDFDIWTWFELCYDFDVYKFSFLFTLRLLWGDSDYQINSDHHMKKDICWQQFLLDNISGRRPARPARRRAPSGAAALAGPAPAYPVQSGASQSCASQSRDDPINCEDKLRRRM